MVAAFMRPKAIVFYLLLSSSISFYLHHIVSMLNYSKWSVTYAARSRDGGQGCRYGCHDDLQDCFPDVVLFHSCRY